MPLASSRLFSPLLACLVAFAVGEGATASPQTPYLVEVGTGFDGPADVTSWPGNPDLLVIAERGSGQVIVVPTNPGGSPPVPNPAVIVDLSTTALIPDDNFASWAVQFGGLTGVAFHPRFNDGRRYRYIFVRYNIGVADSLGSPANDEVDVVIDRFAIPTGTNKASVASQTTVFRERFTSGSASGHFSGRIRFDPRTFYDGTGTTVDDEIYHLHAPMGDMVQGTSQCDPGLEDVHNLLDPQGDPLYAGKLLRFSIGPGALASGPTVPKVTPDVYGRGLRNPYSFTVDRGDGALATEGEVWITDTGQPNPGEIMRWVPPAEGVVDMIGGGLGEEYGWPWVETVLVNFTSLASTQGACWQGSVTPRPFPNLINYELPDYAIPSSGNPAVVGVSVYRGQLLDHTVYGGLLLYAVYGTSPPNLVWRDRSNLLSPNDPAPDLATVLQGGGNPFIPQGAEDFTLTGVGEDTNGDLLLIRMDLNAPIIGNGTIFRVTQ